ncbi:DUF6641 family protein [Azonexus fungiphilus]|uniref:DUF6641 family protein n=1 Tax=Azonexus fungiphilus TaxID=146940 RepID=UPI00156B4807|nr:DUF6641 family protein [Azonexus fungiphilus]NHC08356.1 hypothetical protein [Azonexus fungiphilus]
MALLNGLKLVAAKRSSQNTPTMQRRHKMLKQLEEQINLAQAIAAGSTYAPTKQKKVLNAETGERVTLNVPKRIKQWWWEQNGKCNISVRYGAKIIELSKGKNAIECASAELLSTLALLRDAVIEGELDAQLEQASQAVRPNAK